MVERIVVKDKNDLARLGESAVILNTNQKAYDEYMRTQELLLLRNDKIDNLESRLSVLESKINMYMNSEI
ncbi:MAG: hypothetical protein KAS32_23460 [Candidatus Peribacteraceae bacterium]|nr:hypothetical protein [Candidatus Peribacteraceae bacterium]